ncbi:hypothetical protein [Caudoviricetes sp.]|nr:hypothetical protein [Caudoviricetes sp.]UOF81879.1 hypothetical protein [Caudoviricetes sp.]
MGNSARERMQVTSISSPAFGLEIAERLRTRW